MSDQLLLFSARENRDIGMQRVLAAAQRRDQDFSEKAAHFILQFLKTYTGDYTGEEIVNAAKDAGITPHNDKAFGPVFSRLAQQKLIYKARYVARSKGHAAPGAVIWKLL